ncbi:response regulator transcription factor [Saccharospirillum sp.]|uniref:response regulator transcription factor n=1 Tax=Saccharospirillum sp. TaxID=2033801 RepID=UPI00349FD947
MAEIDGYAHILLVEDNASLAELTQHYLQESGYRVVVISDGEAARRYIVEQQPDLTVLDIMLPSLDGLAVCRQVRSDYKNPIIILTAKNDPLDEILGLEIGADDYLAKPVDPKLLLSRIRANLRRAREFNQAISSQASINGATPTKSPALSVDRRNRVALCRGNSLDLTGPEFDLLALLHSQPGHVFSRDEITHALRGIEYDGQSRVIDMLISSLRSKLPLQDPIKTVRNKGYLLVEEHLLTPED